MKYPVINHDYANFDNTHLDVYVGLGAENVDNTLVLHVRAGTLNERFDLTEEFVVKFEVEVAKWRERHAPVRGLRYQRTIEERRDIVRRADEARRALEYAKANVDVATEDLLAAVAEAVEMLPVGEK